MRPRNGKFDAVFPSLVVLFNYFKNFLKTTTWQIQLMFQRFFNVLLAVTWRIMNINIMDICICIIYDIVMYRISTNAYSMLNTYMHTLMYVSYTNFYDVFKHSWILFLLRPWISYTLVLMIFCFVFQTHTITHDFCVSNITPMPLFATSTATSVSAGCTPNLMFWINLSCPANFMDDGTTTVCEWSGWTGYMAERMNE